MQFKDGHILPLHDGEKRLHSFVFKRLVWCGWKTVTAASKCWQLFAKWLSASHGCAQCEATFSESGKLKAHVAAVHLGLKPHACAQCDVSFSRAGDLRKHVSTKHAGASAGRPGRARRRC